MVGPPEQNAAIVALINLAPVWQECVFQRLRLDLVTKDLRRIHFYLELRIHSFASLLFIL